MIVIILLGIVSAIILPNLIKNHAETQKRTKIRRAMTNYEKMIEQIVIAENITSIADLQSWSKSTTKTKEQYTTTSGATRTRTVTTTDCSNVYKYFKTKSISETSTTTKRDNCTIQTYDGLWWNFSDITKPIVAFNEDDLTATKAHDMTTNDAFYMTTMYSDEARAYLVNDFAHETSENNDKIDIKKTLTFAKILTGELCKDTFCMWKNGEVDYSKTCTGYSYNYKSCTSIPYSGEKWIYDENGKIIVLYSNCDSAGENCTRGQTRIYNNLGQQTEQNNYCDENLENCSSKTAFAYNEEGANVRRIEYFKASDTTRIEICDISKDTYNCQPATFFYGCDDYGKNCSSCKLFMKSSIECPVANANGTYDIPEDVRKTHGYTE